MQKTKFSEEASMRTKLELAKRKLHEGYQQAENGLFQFRVLLFWSYRVSSS